MSSCLLEGTGLDLWWLLSLHAWSGPTIPKQRSGHSLPSLCPSQVQASEQLSLALPGLPQFRFLLQALVTTFSKHRWLVKINHLGSLLTIQMPGPHVKPIRSESLWWRQVSELLKQSSRWFWFTPDSESMPSSVRFSLILTSLFDWNWKPLRLGLEPHVISASLKSEVFCWNYADTRSPTWRTS